MGPRQFGWGTPDGALLVIYLTHSWAEQLASASGSVRTVKLEDAEVPASIDLESAYGQASPSSCLRGCRKRLPDMVALAPAQPRLTADLQRGRLAAGGWLVPAANWYARRAALREAYAGAARHGPGGLHH